MTCSNPVKKPSEHATNNAISAMHSLFTHVARVAGGDECSEQPQCVAVVRWTDAVTIELLSSAMRADNDGASSTASRAKSVCFQIPWSSRNCNAAIAFPDECSVDCANRLINEMTKQRSYCPRNRSNCDAIIHNSVRPE